MGRGDDVVARFWMCHALLDTSFVTSLLLASIAFRCVCVVFDLIFLLQLLTVMKVK